MQFSLQNSICVGLPELQPRIKEAPGPLSPGSNLGQALIALLSGITDLSCQLPHVTYCVRFILMSGI